MHYLGEINKMNKKRQSKSMLCTLFVGYRNIYDSLLVRYG